jgi:hypothetical protein
LLERPGGDQPGQPGTDNDDFHNRYLDFHLYQSLSLFYLNSPNEEGMYFLSRTEGAEDAEYHPSAIAWRHRRSVISQRAALIPYTRWQASQGDSTLRVPAPGME